MVNSPAKGLSASGFGLLLFVLIAASFLPVLLGQASFFFRDYGIFGYPLAQYHREAFWNGEVPLWNPYNNLGIPFLAQWNTMVFYPLSLIYLLLPLPWSLGFFCLFHLWFAGMGMFLLARNWTSHSWGAGLAGIAFTFNGLVLSCLKWPNNIAALGWMPWVILAVTLLLQKRKFAFPLAALAGAFQMLSGAPEIILLTWVFAGSYVCLSAWQQKEQRRKILISFGALVFLVAGLAAVQLLPFLDLLKQSQRDQSFAAAAWPMPIWGWANFLVPLFRTFPSYHLVAAQPDQYWISTYYLGMPALFAALLAMFKAKDARVRLVTALTFVFLWLALGDAGGLYWIAKKVFPVVSVMRFPIKFAALPVFCLCLLSAFGMAWFESQLKQKFTGPLLHPHSLPNKSDALFVVRLGLLLLLGIAVVTCFAPIWPHEHEGWAATLDNGIARALFAIVAFGIFYVRIKVPRMTPGCPRATFFCLSILLFLDVRSHAPWQNPTADPGVFTETFNGFAPVPELGQGRAMISPSALQRLDHQIINHPEKDFIQSRRFLFCNCNLMDRIPKIDGFYALEIKETAEIINKLYEHNDTNYPGLMRFMSVSHLTSSTRPIEWLPGANYLPWITVGRQPIITNNFKAIFSADFDPESVVYLDEAVSGLPLSAVPEAKVTEIKISAHQATFKTTAPSPAMVTVNQAWSKHWKATVDGQPVSLLRVNHAFQGLVIPAGESQVKLTYSDPNFKIGALISALCVACLCFLFYKERK